MVPVQYSPKDRCESFRRQSSSIVLTLGDPPTGVQYVTRPEDNVLAGGAPLTLAVVRRGAVPTHSSTAANNQWMLSHYLVGFRVVGLVRKEGWVRKEFAEEVKRVLNHQ